MEHNAVMRPLRSLAGRGIDLSVIPCSPRGELDPADVEAAFRRHTRLVILTHASNVTGTILPVREIGNVVRPREGVFFCVDAAQTAGALVIDVQGMAIDLLAFTGHKSLFGPQGTGGLYIRKGIESQLLPLMRGGTGSRSEFEEQPDFLPDKYESGTPNTIGLAGLGAGVTFIQGEGLADIRGREEALTGRLLAGLAAMGEGVRVYGPGAAERQVPVVSFNVQGVTPSDAAFYLEEHWGILCRPGLHCAPAAHRTTGTFPGGTVRFSLGYFLDEDAVDGPWRP
jgi:selenocysteine lyase/cysteine desulfurase